MVCLAISYLLLSISKFHTFATIQWLKRFRKKYIHFLCYPKVWTCTPCYSLPPLFFLSSTFLCAFFIRSTLQAICWFHHIRIANKCHHFPHTHFISDSALISQHCLPTWVTLHIDFNHFKGSLPDVLAHQFFSKGSRVYCSSKVQNTHPTLMRAILELHLCLACPIITFNCHGWTLK